MIRRHFVALLALAVSLAACGSREAKGPYDTDPTQPEGARAKFAIEEGFEIELFASEPYVVDPVEMCFDEDGGVYVAEMLDYPFDPDEGKPPRSRVRFLEDTTGDGRIDKATVFADELLHATSVFPWKGGVFVTSAPHIYYLKDTTGDRVADVKEIWYTGFDVDVSSESRITNLRFGIDNWIYAANNGRPGSITSPKFPEKPPVLVRGYDFRFNPVTGDFGPAGGPTQFGMSFDEWGARFVSQNTIHLRHVVLPAHYVLRNPYYQPGSMLHYPPGDDPSNSVVYPLTEPQRWRVERTQVRQERYDETWPGRVELVGGHFTAATGATVYVGDALGEAIRGNVFVADANGNLVRRTVLFDDGPTFRSEPRPAGREFLASTDVWFRPVNMANGPDGNLYILDFYREYIEEPASIPESIKDRLQLDFYRGDDRGRIWRVRGNAPPDPARLKPGLGEVPATELVRTLEHVNGWHRRTAQRLLVERQNRGAAEALRALAAEGKTPQARLHALWTLAGLGALEASHVRIALDDEHPRVRANAVRLAEGFLPGFSEAIGRAAEDPDPKVRFQAALSLGQIPSNHRLLARMAAREADDPWFRSALLTSAGERPLAVLTRLVTSHGDFFTAGDAASRREFVSELTALTAARRDREQLGLLLQMMGASPRLRPAEWRAAALAGLARGLALDGRRNLVIPGAEAVMAALMSDGSDTVRDASIEAAQYLSLPRMTADALRAAASRDLDLDRRVRAVKFLRGASFAAARPVLERILKEPSPQELQVAALEALEVFEDPGAAEIILASWPGYAPAARERAAAAVLRRPHSVAKLLDEVEAGRIAPGRLDPVTKIRLTQFPEQGLQERALRLFEESGGRRADVVENYLDVAKLQADASRGKEVFQEHCAQCHLPQGERGRIGPDLSGVNNKSREELLTHILDPSFEIPANYTNYIVADKRGRIYDGLLAGESALAVTLRGEYENVTILRENIEEMRASSVSLMPDGLEEQMSRQDLADVIAYLRAGI